jgi:hypothetical protein
MRDKIVLALAGLPSIGNHGGAQTCYGILEALRKQYDIHVISLYEKSNQYLKDKKKNEEQLKKLNIKISYIEIESDSKKSFIEKFFILKDLFYPNLENYYKWSKYKNKISLILSKINPKFIICYHYEPLVAIYNLNYKIYAMFGDPTQKLIENFFNRKISDKIFYNIIYKLQLKILTNILDRLFVKITKKCENVFFFAAHYVKWSNNLGVKSNYIRTPLYDNFTKTRKTNEKFSILMIGDLSGTVTKSGIDYFFDKIYPKLIKKINPNEFNVNIIGRNFNYYKKKYNSFKNVNFLGRIEPANKYFLKSDIILTPNPIDLGIRVRIVTAFAYGCPVITHYSNKKGIPEIKNNFNALVAESSKKITKHIVTIYKNPALKKKISQNGKKTFKKFFTHNAFLENFNKLKK